MKAITKYWIILLCLLGLLYLWDSSLVAIAQEQVEARQPTQLTTQSPVVTTDDHARIALQLQSVTGTPIANAIILLSGHQPQAEQIETDENGQAWWQLPDGFAHGEYVLKAVFGGSATLQPAIAVLKLTLQPTSTSAAVTRGPLVGEPLARKPLSTRLESKTVAQEAVQQAAIESRTVPRASVIAAKVAKNTTAVARNVSQPTTANPVAQFANPMPSLTVISFRQQAAGLLAAMRSLATVLPRGPASPSVF
ncbi:MAG: hypothetical protein R2932_47110 [Caldilineaceae bacterium]